MWWVVGVVGVAKRGKPSMAPSPKPEKRREFMFEKRMAFLVASVLIAMPIRNVEAAGDIEGVWTCTVVRAGTIERPVLLTFNNDGTLNYSSAISINTISSGSLQNSGFHSRGGGHGEWKKISKDVISYKSVEFVYDANGNAAGSFAVNSTQLLMPNDQLCSGRAECPNQSTIFSVAKYVFDQNDPDADIVGVSYLLPPNSPTNLLCNRLSSGVGFPGMPIPMP